MKAKKEIENKIALKNARKKQIYEYLKEHQPVGLERRNLEEEFLKINTYINALNWVIK